MALEPIDYYDETLFDSTVERRLEQRERTAIELLARGVHAADGSFLDVGCGDGSFLRAVDEQQRLSARGWTLTGIDFSPHMIELASALPYRFERCNLEEGIPFEAGTFDVLFLGEVIEHVYNPDHLLEECRRVLRPGGHIVVTTPNLQAWYNRILFLLGIQPLYYETSTRTTAVGAGMLRRIKRGTAPVGHLRVFNRRALIDIIENEGFETLQVAGAIMPVLPKPVQRVDAQFNRFTSLASEFIVLARRP